MSRTFRFKKEDALYHVICKSISELGLYRDSEDKTKYLMLIKKYKLIYNFKLYGYCLMDTHSHLIIDANGSDISKVMHGVNFSYALYYNKKYKRKGHLFGDRFKSIIVGNDRYLKTLSLYVHNNPRDIVEYKDCPEKYVFSSLAIFLGKEHDYFNLVDYGYVMSLFGNSPEKSRKNYHKLISRCNEEKLKEEIEFEDEAEFNNEKTEYRSGRTLLVRNLKSNDIIEFIVSKMKISKVHLNMKYSRKVVQAKALAVILMRCLCDFKSSDICTILGNITQSRVSKLSTIGISLIENSEEFKNIIQDFIDCYS